MVICIYIPGVRTDQRSYARLRREIEDCTASGEDAANCVYLRGVVREGLRLSWANPTRLPRRVPSGGWKFKDYSFPADTSVGISAFQLHQNPTVFPEPQKFIPERWADPTDAMLTNFFAFGKGTRTCIAQSLATVELTQATLKAAQADVLRGAKVVQDRIEIKEWFNSRVDGEKILIQFPPSP